MAINFIKTIPAHEIKAVRRWMLITLITTVSIFICLSSITFFDNCILSQLYDQRQVLRHSRDTSRAHDQQLRAQHESNKLKKIDELMKTGATKNRNSLETAQAILKLFPAPYLRLVQINPTTVELTAHCTSFDEIQSKLSELEKLNSLEKITLHTMRKSHLQQSDNYLITIKATIRDTK